MTQEAHREKARMSTDSTISNLTQKTVTAVDVVFLGEVFYNMILSQRTHLDAPVVDTGWKKDSEDKILAM